MLLFPFSQMRKATHFVVLGHIFEINPQNLVWDNLPEKQHWPFGDNIK
jgi:hypothetical protein